MTITEYADGGQLWFLLAAAGGLAACLPVIVVGSAQAGSQINWIPRPDLDLTDFAFFGRSLFYSTSVAAALIILAVLAWAVAWREAAIMTALVPVPHELFVAATAARAGTLYPVPCPKPAACLGAEPRIWVVGAGYARSPYQAVTPAQATLLRPRYRLSHVKHVQSLTVFLLTRAPQAGLGA